MPRRRRNSTTPSRYSKGHKPARFKFKVKKVPIQGQDQGSENSGSEVEYQSQSHSQSQEASSSSQSASDEVQLRRSQRIPKPPSDSYHHYFFPNKCPNKTESDHSQQCDDEEIFAEGEFVDKLPADKRQLSFLLRAVKRRSRFYRESFIKEHIQSRCLESKSFVDENAIPICADIRTFDFELLRLKQLEFGGRLFDVIMMDPPWKLTSEIIYRGVRINYECLQDDIIEDLPIPRLQESGFICIWTINKKYRQTCQMLKRWGYQLVDEITWVKLTENGKLAKGLGYYLQHAKQSALIGVKGIAAESVSGGVSSDVIVSKRGGQSQKPKEIYQLLEKLVPNGYYLEIFGRRNNLRGGWVTIGNQI